MNTRVETVEGTCTIYVEGSIDTGSAEQLEAAIDANMDESNVLVIDFTDVDYITSAGMRVLLKTEMNMRDQGEFQLANVNEDVYNVLKLANFQRFLVINGKSIETSDDNLDDVQYTFGKYALSAKERDEIPVALLTYLQNSNTAIYALTDDDDEAQMYSVVYEISEEELCIIYNWFGKGSNQVSCLKQMISNLKDKYEDVEQFTLRLYTESNDPSEFDNLAEKIEAGKQGLSGAYLQYNMDRVRKSTIYKSLNKMKPLMESVKMLNELNQIELFDMQISKNIDINNLDPVFCRFYEYNDELIGMLNGIEVLPEQVVLNELTVEKVPGSDKALPIMLASFVSSFADLMSEQAILHIDCHNPDLIKGLETLLGKPDTKWNYFLYTL